MFLEQLENNLHYKKLLFRWINQDESQQTLTNVDLWDQSGGVAEKLTKHGIKQGDRVIICYPFGLEFLAGFLGCLRVGAIVVSVYPPNPKQLSKDVPLFRRFAEDSDSKIALTTTKYRWLLRSTSTVLYNKSWPNLTWITTDSIKGKPFATVHSRAQDIAFIQYTSGSTGNPKGVMVSYGALVKNLTTIATLSSLDTNSIGVCWLPQYHDYSLIANYLMTLYLNGMCVYMSPLTFIKKPLLWAKYIEKYSATHAGGPNFGWHLLAKNMPTNQYNLSTLVSATLGGELIQGATLQSMIRMGIGKEAIDGTYGMAECVLHITSGGSGVHEGHAACGRLDTLAQFNKHVVIADNHQPLPDGTIGTIMVQGDDLASGYWNKPEETERTFHNILTDRPGQWLDTGDLGFIHNNQLYITGRKKELIIVNGKNIYPTDIETAAMAQLPTVLRPGCMAAYQCHDGIGFVAELRATTITHESETTLITVLNSFGPVVRIRLIAKGHMLKTTSGKIKRTALGNHEFKSLYEWQHNQPIKGSLNQRDQVEVTIPLANNWEIYLARVFNVNDPTISFLDYGLSSIQLVHAIDQIKNDHMIDTLDFDTVSNYNTVQQLATYLSDKYQFNHIESPYRNHHGTVQYTDTNTIFSLKLNQRNVECASLQGKQVQVTFNNAYQFPPIIDDTRIIDEFRQTCNTHAAELQQYDPSSGCITIVMNHYQDSIWDALFDTYKECFFKHNITIPYNKTTRQKKNEYSYNDNFESNLYFYEQCTTESSREEIIDKIQQLHNRYMGLNVVLAQEGIQFKKNDLQTYDMEDLSSFLDTFDGMVALVFTKTGFALVVNHFICGHYGIYKLKLDYQYATLSTASHPHTSTATMDRYFCYTDNLFQQCTDQDKKFWQSQFGTNTMKEQYTPLRYRVKITNKNELVFKQVSINETNKSLMEQKSNTYNVPIGIVFMYYYACQSITHTHTNNSASSPNMHHYSIILTTETNKDLGFVLPYVYKITPDADKFFQFYKDSKTHLACPTYELVDTINVFAKYCDVVFTEINTSLDYDYLKSANGYLDKLVLYFNKNTFTLYSVYNKYKFTDELNDFWDNLNDNLNAALVNKLHSIS